jgi:dTDP-4-dehydrorhamnose 3,5-epimerase-like enzyme
MAEQHSDRRLGLIEFRAIGDQRGWLTPLEEGKEIPFPVKRVYMIYGTLPEISRGFHAHRDLEQVAICVAGSCTFIVDDGFQRQEYVLDSPSRGLYINSMVWREMHRFSPDCVLVVLASRLYDESDYIRDYMEFKRMATGATYG